MKQNLMTFIKSNLFVLVFLMNLLLMVPSAQAQQDSQYTQYMYNTSAINPAYAGSKGSLNIIGLYRNQWIGLDGAPETLNFSLNSPIGVQGVGLGLGFTSDKIGPSSESIITADFSYTLNLTSEVKLAFGIKGGFSMFNLDPNKLNIYDPNDYDLQIENRNSPVIGAGLYMHSEKWYVGLSSPNLLETTYYDGFQSSTALEKKHIYFISGYVFTVNPDLKLKPTLLVKAVTGAPLAIDLSANALLYNKVTFGLAYRLDAAVSALAGFQISDNMMMGYAYDYDTTELGNYNSGSHEFFLNFELGTLLRGKVNPRFF